ncbi:helix-turn-helix domain-containing protein [Prescottella equi]
MRALCCTEATKDDTKGDQAGQTHARQRHDKTEIAKALGVGRTTLYRHLK